MKRINNILKKLGNTKNKTKGDFLFKKEDNDTNLYFILKGKILLFTDNIDIAIVEENEILGEKSFIENKSKPINAKAISNVEYIELSKNMFEQLPEYEKTNLFKELTLFISQRVDLLNDIINTLSKINTKISYSKVELSIDYLLEIFSDIIKIKNIYIYKFMYGGMLPLFESNLNHNLQEELKKYANEDRIIKQSKGSYIIKTGEYLFYIEGEKLKTNYIINNVFMHSIASFKYLGYLIETEKNKSLENMIEC